MSITEELSQLPKAERLRCMEALWDTLRGEEVRSPDWHGKVLAARAAAVESGEAGFVSEETLLERVSDIQRKR